MIYIYILILFLLLFKFENNTKLQKIRCFSNNKIAIKDAILVISLVLFFVVCTFKSISVGTDTKNYLMLYNYPSTYIRKYFYSINFEWLFYVFIYICQIIGFSFHGFLFVYYAIMFLLLYKFVKNYSKQQAISAIAFLVFGYLFMAMSGLRQMMAVMLILNYYDSLLNKKLFKSILYLFLACSFHKSAIICITVLPLLFISYNKELSIVTSSIVLGSSIFFPNLY